MTKSLYGAPIEDKQHYPKLAQIQFNLKELYPEARWTKLTEIQLDTLQWAKEFMDGYERRNRIRQKSERVLEQA